MKQPHRRSNLSRLSGYRKRLKRPMQIAGMGRGLVDGDLIGMYKGKPDALVAQWIEHRSSELLKWDWPTRCKTANPLISSYWQFV